MTNKERIVWYYEMFKRDRIVLAFELGLITEGEYHRQIKALA